MLCSGIASLTGPVFSEMGPVDYIRYAWDRLDGAAALRGGWVLLSANSSNS